MNPGVYGTAITDQNAHYGDTSDMPPIDSAFCQSVPADQQQLGGETFEEMSVRVHREIARDVAIL